MKKLLQVLQNENISKETLEAIKKTNRIKFIPEDKPESIERAYEDTALSIGHNVTISQPSLVGKMIDLLQIEPTNNILELGTGSSYNAAIMSKLLRSGFGGGTLTTVERVKVLANRAKKLLSEKNIKVIAGDALNVKYSHKFDRIIATAEFLDQKQIETFVKSNSNLFCICVYPFEGWLWKMVKCGDAVKTNKLLRVRFVPVLTGLK